MPKQAKRISNIKDVFQVVYARLKLNNPEISRKEIYLIFDMEYTKYYRIEQIEEYKEYWVTSDKWGMDEEPCIKDYQY